MRPCSWNVSSFPGKRTRVITFALPFHVCVSLPFTAFPRVFTAVRCLSLWFHCISVPFLSVPFMCVCHCLQCLSSRSRCRSVPFLVVSVPTTAFHCVLSPPSSAFPLKKNVPETAGPDKAFPSPGEGMHAYRYSKILGVPRAPQNQHTKTPLSCNPHFHPSCFKERCAAPPRAPQINALRRLGVLCELTTFERKAGTSLCTRNIHKSQVHFQSLD